MFERIVVGADGSEQGLYTARLANRLRADNGRLLAVTVAERHLAVYAGLQAVEWDQRVREDAQSASEAIGSAFADERHVESKLVTGHAGRELLTEAESFGADLIAVGSRGQGRAAGIILGSVATRVIHDARCSVLVGRGDLRPELFPRKIVVGFDGSEQSEHARALGEQLARDLHGSCRSVTGVKELHQAAAECDLLIVGSRGLHGLPALGSVAERIAHEAPCPVLIVRGKYEAEAAPS